MAARSNAGKGKKTARRPVKTRPANKKKPKSNSPPIVGIGGAAGGFEGTIELLRNLPPASGMTFVVVQHLDPHHTSRLAMLLSKVTQMPVLEVTGKIKPKENTVYVQPPNKCIVCREGFLALIQRTERFNLAIDHFFESLAEWQGSRAIGVVL